MFLCFFVEVNSFHLHLQSPSTNFLPVLVEKDYLSRSKINSGISEVLVHPARSLACSGDWFELPKNVGGLGPLLQVEVVVRVFAVVAAT